MELWMDMWWWWDFCYPVKTFQEGNPSTPLDPSRFHWGNICTSFTKGMTTFQQSSSHEQIHNFKIAFDWSYVTLFQNHQKCLTWIFSITETFHSVFIHLYSAWKSAKMSHLRFQFELLSTQNVNETFSVIFKPEFRVVTVKLKMSIPWHCVDHVLFWRGTDQVFRTEFIIAIMNCPSTPRTSRWTYSV